MKAIVTVKIEESIYHNPHKKSIGICPVNRMVCTDITGAHHSMIIEGETLSKIREKTIKKGYKHITRIEVIK